jgi:hypothetical protein
MDEPPAEIAAEALADQRQILQAAADVEHAVER